MNEANREKMLLVAAITAVVVLFGDKFIVSPMMDAWKDRSARIEELDAKVTRGRALMENEGSIRKRWALMYHGAIPKMKSVSENQILESVDRWATESRISFTSIKPSWRTSDKGHLLLECRANGFGDLEKVARFVHALESDPMALKVDTLELSQRDEKGSSLGMNLNFSGLLLPQDLQ